MAADSPGLQRRGYLDFLRGIAVLLMIDAHLFDSWTRFPDRETAAFSLAILLGGMGTKFSVFSDKIFRIIGADREPVAKELLSVGR